MDQRRLDSDAAWLAALAEDWDAPLAEPSEPAVEVGSDGGEAAVAPPRDAPEAIPKALHFLWIGSALPSRASAAIDTWRRHHPRWTVNVWDDEAISSFRLANWRAYAAAPNHGERSDIARYEILHRLGGVYVDCDMVCVAPIDSAIEGRSLVVGMSATATIEVNNAFIAAAPRHPTLRRLIRAITVHHRAMQSTERALHPALAAALQLGSGARSAADTIEATGPGLLTRTLFAALRRSASGGGGGGGGGPNRPACTVLPPHCAFPLPNWQRDLLRGRSVGGVAALAARARARVEAGTQQPEGEGGPADEAVASALASAFEAEAGGDWRAADAARPLASSCPPPASGRQHTSWPVLCVHLWDCSWQQPPAPS